MHELAFLLEEFSDPGFNIQINQIHRMGEFIHQSPQKAIEMPGWTTTDTDVQIGPGPMPSGSDGAENEHISASFRLAYLHRKGYIGAVLVGNRCRRHGHLFPPKRKQLPFLPCFRSSFQV